MTDSVFYGISMPTYRHYSPFYARESVSIDVKALNISWPAAVAQCSECVASSRLRISYWRSAVSATTVTVSHTQRGSQSQKIVANANCLLGSATSPMTWKLCYLWSDLSNCSAFECLKIGVIVNKCEISSCGQHTTNRKVFWVDSHWKHVLHSTVIRFPCVAHIVCNATPAVFASYIQDNEYNKCHSHRWVCRGGLGMSYAWWQQQFVTCLDSRVTLEGNCRTGCLTVNYLQSPQCGNRTVLHLTWLDCSFAARPVA